MEEIIKRVAADKTHGGIPFWSWNDKLEKQELRRQIRNMKDLGMRGFFMHARGGLETEYMSDEWFDCIKACIDEAKKCDMEAWAYDENGWPSGFAGGELLKDPTNHAAFLVCEKTSEFPTASDDLLGVYKITNQNVIRLDSPCEVTDEYIVIRRGRDFSYVDVLNPTVTKQFTEKTHEIYKKEIGDDFGNVMPGFFTDEPQYYRWGTPWSDTFKETFENRFGYDVLDGLPALFFDYNGAEEFRYDYHLLLHESFILNFVKPLYDWCSKNGVKLTGHGIEEWGIGEQMMCCGGIMPFYRYQHIPGIDYLGRSIKNITGSKQLGSVCEQLGKSVRLSEMFACCGWDVNPLELKRIADVQFVGGVNLICEHLYPYSERGQRKRDYPNHYSDHNPWQSEYKNFETHFSHLGSLLSQGHELADILVIHPIHSAYLDYKHNDFSTVEELNRKYNELADNLADNQIPFHFGDETIMRDLGKVDGDTIRIGNCQYNKVIIPFCYTLDSSTVNMLRQYADNGGKIYLWDKSPNRIDGKQGDLSFLKSNITYQDLASSSGIKVKCNDQSVPVYMQVRITDAGRIIFVTNPSGNEYPNVEITVNNCSSLMLLDPLTLEKKKLRGKQNSDGSATIVFDFGDSASCVLIEKESDFLPFEYTVEKEKTLLSPSFTVIDPPENTLLLSEAAVSLNGGEYSEIRPIVRIRDNLLHSKFSGKLSLRFTFNAETVPNTLILVAEPMKYDEIFVNDTKIKLDSEHGRFDRSFVGADIAHYTKKGINTITMTFDYFQSEHVYDVLYGGGSESLRNCLAFDTEIEDIYLYGNFKVESVGGFKETSVQETYRAKGPFVLKATTDKIDISDIVKDGYPFFAGRMTVGTTFKYNEGDPTTLELGGRLATCVLSVNGHTVEGDIFTRRFDLSSQLKVGNNDIKMTVVFSNRNLLGPHHRKDPEPFAVSPTTFSFEKEWDENICPSFVPEPAFVKFGVTLKSI